MVAVSSISAAQIASVPAATSGTGTIPALDSAPAPGASAPPVAAAPPAAVSFAPGVTDALLKVSQFAQDSKVDDSQRAEARPAKTESEPPAPKPANDTPPGEAVSDAQFLQGVMGVIGGVVAANEGFQKALQDGTVVIQRGAGGLTSGRGSFVAVGPRYVIGAYEGADFFVSF